MTDIFLRKFKEKDIKTLERCMGNSSVPVVCAYPGMTARQLLEDYLSFDQDREIALAIVDKETDECVGGIHALAIDDDLLISYYVSEDMQRKGIATEGLKQFAQFARTKTSALRLILNIGVANVASMKVAKKNGFTLMEVCECGTTWGRFL